MKWFVESVSNFFFNFNVLNALEHFELVLWIKDNSIYVISHSVPCLCSDRAICNLEDCFSVRCKLYCDLYSHLFSYFLRLLSVLVIPNWLMTFLVVNLIVMLELLKKITLILRS